MSDAIYCYHLVSLCRVLLVFSVWLISISVNIMSQLCLIHFWMWLLLVATSVHSLVFYWHNESLKWTVLLQGSVFSLLAWLITVLIHRALQCFRLDFNMTPHIWMPNWGVGVSSFIAVNVVYLCPFYFYESTAVVENRSMHSPTVFYCLFFMEQTYVKYAVTFHFPVDFKLTKNETVFLAHWKT